MFLPLANREFHPAYDQCECVIIFDLHVAETEDTLLSVSGSGFFLTTADSLLTTVEHQTADCSNITCREGFYCIDGTNDVNNAVCNPSCASWKQFSDSINDVFDSLLLMSTCIGLLCGVGVLIVAGIRRNKV